MSSAATSTASTVLQARQDRVRVVGLMVKKPGMTDEAFRKYWQEVHGPLFSNLEIVKKNILKYEQLHYNMAAFVEGATAIGFEAVPYHGLGILEAESYAKILEVFQSEEYARTAFTDELNFVDRTNTGIMTGPLFTYIDKN